MIRRKELTALIERVSALEEDLKRLIKAQGAEKSPDEDTISYEEVIDQWLNGREER
jgi:hypothetical protein